MRVSQGCVFLRDACFPTHISLGMRVSLGCLFPHTHIPRDVCFPAHISLMHFILQVIVMHVFSGILFPHRHRY